MKEEKNRTLLAEEFPEQMNPRFVPDILLIIGIFLVSVNLRTHLAGVGPLLPMISRDYNLTSSQIGLMTTVPLVAFGLISPLVARFTDRFGIEKMIFAGIFTMFITSILRVFTGPAGLYFFTFILGAGLSICNVALPSLIKKDFPIHMAGTMTSMYTITFSGFGAIASGVSVPIANSSSLGWKAGILVWSITAIIASLVWLPQLKKEHKTHLGKAEDKKEKVSKSVKAWHISLFMGTSSALLYIAMGWLSEIMLSRGFTETQGGWAFAILQFAVMPATMIVPIIASKMKDHRKIVRLGMIPLLIGVIGLIIPSESIAFVYIASILYGFGYGTTLGLAMVMFNLKTKTPSQAAAMSGMAQSIGYIMAAIAPVIFGKIYDFTGNWSQTMIMMIVLVVLTLFFGSKAGKEGYVIDEVKLEK